MVRKIEKKEKHSGKQDKIHPKEALLGIAVSISVAVFLIGHLIASFIDSGNTWGFHHWIFYPLHLKIVFICSLLCCIPKINGYILKNIIPSFSRLSSKLPNLNKFLWAFVVALLFLPIFWLLRTKTHFLGDGYMLSRVIASGTAFMSNKPFDIYIHHLVHKVFNNSMGWTAEMSFAFVSCAAGMCFVFSLVLLSYLIGRDLSKKVILFFSVLFTGTIQLFFGYIESYSLLTFEVLMFTLVALYYLKNKVNIFFPSLVFSFMFCTHISAFILFPSLLYLFFYKCEGHILGKNNVKLFIGMLLGIAIPVIVLIILMTQLGLNLGALTDDLGKESHIISVKALCSLSHFTNILNEITLIAPLVIPLGLLIPFFLPHAKKRRNEITTFLLVMSALCFANLIFLKPDLGASRDWDLYAMSSIPWTLFIIYAFINSPISTQSIKKIGLILIPALFTHTAPWVMVNADADRSLKRFNILVDSNIGWSDTAVGNGYDELRTYYYDRGMLDVALAYAKKATNAVRNSRYDYNLGIIHYEKEMYDKAISVLKKVDDSSTYAADAHFKMGNAYLKLNNDDEAILEFQKGVKLDPNHAKAYSNLGTVYLQQGKAEEAIASLHKALQLDPGNADYYYNMGVAYLLQDKTEEATAALRKALKINPTHKLARETLRKSQDTTGTN